jgi:hypothetical protein
MATAATPSPSINPPEWSGEDALGQELNIHRSTRQNSSRPQVQALRRLPDQSGNGEARRCPCCSPCADGQEGPRQDEPAAKRQSTSAEPINGSSH